MALEEKIHSVREVVRHKLELLHSMDDKQLTEFIEKAVFDLSKTQYIPVTEKKTIVDTIYYSFRGFDILQPLIDDKSITEIMINNYDEIFIEQEGKVFLSPIRFDNQEKLEDIIQTMVAKVNRVVNESSPIVDARLKDGSRISIVLPPIALKGPTMTIRKFPEKPFTMDDLVRRGALSEEAKHFLQILVEAKFNIFIGGGTGSGKTTFLNALSNYIPQDERIVTIEDSAELQILSVPNLVKLETRNGNVEGRGQISIRELIRTSLRMRPNRIIVGEVRGSEALDMLQAMNTGHDGSLSTGHANSVKDMISRLETMVLSGANLPIEVIRKQIGSAIDIMIHLTRLRDKTRKVTEISEVIGLRDGEIELNPLFQFVEDAGAMEGPVKGELIRTGSALQKTAKLSLAGWINERR